MTRDELLELADRVEKLSRPDKQVDAMIRCAVFAPAGAYVEQSRFNGAWCIYHGANRNGEPLLWERRGLTPEQRLGEFTASLDSAMTLVPEGWTRFGGNANGYEEMTLTNDDLRRTVISFAATPALALTSASLRAIASRVG